MIGRANLLAMMSLLGLSGCASVQELVCENPNARPVAQQNETWQSPDAAEPGKTGLVARPMIAGPALQQRDGRYVLCRDCMVPTPKTPAGSNAAMMPDAKHVARHVQLNVHEMPTVAATPRMLDTEPVAAKPAQTQDMPARQDSNIDVFFGNNQSALSEKSRQVLSGQLEAFKQADRITLYGSTDHTGAKQYNQLLALSRALAVKDYLIEQGIDNTKISISSVNLGMSQQPSNESGNDAGLRKVRVVLEQAPGKGAQVSINLNQNVTLVN